ncbi:MAG: DUF4198 domain-containing protein [Candidatus Electrothrix sp. AUS3]|nr:DUF4198 domain-containing protein [Candidatus Electrothrix gigas]
MRNQYITLALCLGMIVLGSSQASGHYAWINADNYSHHTGEMAKMNIGYGHGYPLGSFLQQEEMADMTLLDPAGKKVPLKSINSIEYETEEALSTPGVYTIAAQRKAVFYSKTTEGWKKQSKEGLENVLRCVRSNKSTKGVLTVDSQDATMNKEAVGHPLEIIPQANPATLKAGDYFPVQLLLRGKPYKSKIFATYMGFSTDKDVFAYTAKTDQKGMGKIRLLQSGIWLIKADYEEPYADQKICDAESFAATLTFEVK